METTVVGGAPYYVEENVVMQGFDYDPATRYICGGFPRMSPSVPVTIACFDTDKYPVGSSPVWTPFSSYWDNDLPVR